MMSISIYSFFFLGGGGLGGGRPVTMIFQVNISQNLKQAPGNKALINGY